MGVWDWLMGRKPGRVEPEAPTIEVTIERGRSSPPDDYVSPYLPSERSAELLVLDAQGMPPLRMKLHHGEWWLSEESTGLFVNVGNRALRGLGIWSVRVRGDDYAPGQLHAGPVQLVREPGNEHDVNAIAIVQHGVRCGYWNKSMARALSKVLDSGSALEAVAISADPPKVVAAEPHVLRHIIRGMR
ncbi:HIRAN domain-containing protein [Microbacterium sp. 1P10UB]|uniref:HIRAN domain-containing protein n=1 Tax=unclassified Microbacterium TaxID=2609290 RepID=UPI00399FB67C